MRVSPRRARQIIRAGNVVVALAASAGLLGLLGAGHGGIPALGRVLVPGHGAWTSAAGAKLPVPQSLTLPGLTQPVRVSFTRQGLATISAHTDDDAYLALGYLHATFRLTQMDLERRQAEGRLAQLIGPAGLASDRFELELGLLRTARQEWAQLPKSSAAAQALIAYSEGVNDYLAQARASKQWPALFTVDGVYPATWTPVDSLAVQGELTQELDFTTAPLDYALLERSLGAQHTMAWFNVQPPNQQSPWDPGPYRSLGLAAVPATEPSPAAAPRVTSPGGSAQTTTTSYRRAARRTPRELTTTDGQTLDQAQIVSAGLAEASAAVLAQTAALPADQLYSGPASSAWAANGPKVSGGGAMLAGDPNLPQTLPSIWYQAAMSAPGLAVSGASVPGLPGILIGHNTHIAWSLTDDQAQATLFYAEQTRPGSPPEYLWQNQWHRMSVLHYTIPVRGQPSAQLYVQQTVHGPVLTAEGQTVAVDWMGALGSPDVAAILAIDRASNYAQVKAALAGWRSPALTFVYADDRGNIGAIAAGYIPEVRNGDPWLPLPGTGADDVAGVIPDAALPQVYDPSSHVIAAASQRPVGSSYPYYLGTTADFSDPGYRADAEYAYLDQHSSMGPADFAALQNDLGDQLASVIVPKLLAALRGAPLTSAEQLAEQTLASWDDQMTAGSAGASIWWTFWAEYLSEVFDPWWAAAKVPVLTDQSGLRVGPGLTSLDEDLENWTLDDQSSPAFSPPGLQPRTAGELMRISFAKTVDHLVALFSGGPGLWQWGKLHTREFPSLTRAAALGYGPRAAGGDIWTVDAAEGQLTSDIGPSWRMIVHWSRAGRAEAEAVYPGGQSENPASPWYSNLIGDWWAGTYLPLPAVSSGASGSAAAGTITWELQP
jgi:penicillin G amidase